MIRRVKVMFVVDIGTCVFVSIKTVLNIVLVVMLVEIRLFDLMLSLLVLCLLYFRQLHLSSPKF